MAGRVMVDGKSIPIGNDPNYDYVRDYRRSQIWQAQTVACHKCHVDMVAKGRALSPLYGTTGEIFECSGCKASFTVYPRVSEGPVQ